MLTDEAPLGFTSPWHRADVFDTHVAAPGFTLAARQPQYPFTVVTRIHGWARRYLDFAVPADDVDVVFARERFEAAARAAGDDLGRYPGSDTFRDVGPVTGDALMTNHSLNLQKTRLLERKPGQVPVASRETFAAYDVDWSVLDRYADYFRGTREFFWRRDLWRRTLPVRVFFRKVRRRLRRIISERLTAIR